MPTVERTTPVHRRWLFALLVLAIVTAAAVAAYYGMRKQDVVFTGDPELWGTMRLHAADGREYKSALQIGPDQDEWRIEDVPAGKYITEFREASYLGYFPECQWSEEIVVFGPKRTRKLDLLLTRLVLVVRRGRDPDGIPLLVMVRGKRFPGDRYFRGTVVREDPQTVIAPFVTKGTYEVVVQRQSTDETLVTKSIQLPALQDREMLTLEIDVASGRIEDKGRGTFRWPR